VLALVTTATGPPVTCVKDEHWPPTGEGGGGSGAGGDRGEGGRGNGAGGDCGDGGDCGEGGATVPAVMSVATPQDEVADETRVPVADEYVPVRPVRDTSAPVDAFTPRPDTQAPLALTAVMAMPIQEPAEPEGVLE